MLVTEIITWLEIVLPLEMRPLLLLPKNATNVRRLGTSPGESFQYPYPTHERRRLTLTCVRDCTKVSEELPVAE